jgi:hypothetical protein
MVRADKKLKAQILFKLAIYLLTDCCVINISLAVCVKLSVWQAPENI